MSKWINAAEAALADIKKVSKTPYDYGKFSSSDNKLPDSYIVYFLVSHPPGLFADNKEVSSEPRIQVSFFFRKKKYSMYENKIVCDYRDGRITKEELDACSTCENCIK